MKEYCTEAELCPSSLIDAALASFASMHTLTSSETESSRRAQDRLWPSCCMRVGAPHVGSFSLLSHAYPVLGTTSGVASTRDLGTRDQLAFERARNESRVSAKTLQFLIAFAGAHHVGHISAASHPILVSHPILKPAWPLRTNYPKLHQAQNPLQA